MTVPPRANRNRARVPWIAAFAHKGWYMQPETNFSMIDDALHAGGCDIFFAGHVHTYQRFYPLRTSPYGPNATRPNNVPRDIDFDCASTERGAGYAHGSNASGSMVANNSASHRAQPRTVFVIRVT